MALFTTPQFEFLIGSIFYMTLLNINPKLIKNHFCHVRRQQYPLTNHCFLNFHASRSKNTFFKWSGQKIRLEKPSQITLRMSRNPGKIFFSTKVAIALWLECYNKLILISIPLALWSLELKWISPKSSPHFLWCWDLSSTSK